MSENQIMVPGQKNGNITLAEPTIVVYLIEYNKLSSRSLLFLDQAILSLLAR